MPVHVSIYFLAYPCYAFLGILQWLPRLAFLIKLLGLSKRMTLKNQSTFNRIMIGFWGIPAEQNTSSSVRHYQSLSLLKLRMFTWSPY